MTIHNSTYREARTIMSEEAGANAIDPNTMSIIVTKGSLDWAYPPFILSTTAAAMGLDVTMFFTFYGLPCCSRKWTSRSLLWATPP